MRKRTLWITLFAAAGWAWAICSHLGAREKLVYRMPDAVIAEGRYPLDLVVIDRGTAHSHVYEIFFRAKESKLPYRGNTFVESSDSIEWSRFQVERTGPSAVVVSVPESGFASFSGSIRGGAEGHQTWSRIDPPPTADGAPLPSSS